MSYLSDCQTVRDVAKHMLACVEYAVTFEEMTGNPCSLSVTAADLAHMHAIVYRGAQCRTFGRSDRVYSTGYTHPIGPEENPMPAYPYPIDECECLSCLYLYGCEVSGIAPEPVLPREITSDADLILYLQASVNVRDSRECRCTFDTGCECEPVLIEEVTDPADIAALLDILSAAEEGNEG